MNLGNSAILSFQSKPVEFEGTDEDQIQNTPLGEPAILKCQVNQPISFCSWIMPHGAVLSKSEGKTTILFYIALLVNVNILLDKTRHGIIR